MTKQSLLGIKRQCLKMNIDLINFMYWVVSDYSTEQEAVSNFKPGTISLFRVTKLLVVQNC